MRDLFYRNIRISSKKSLISATTTTTTLKSSPSFNLTKENFYEFFFSHLPTIEYQI